MVHWKNLTLENLSEEVDSIFYNERWTCVNGFEEDYLVSDFGRVKSMGRIYSNRHRVPKMLKQAVVPQGYLFVTLYRQGNRKMISVHRLVAIAFIPNPENKPEVNHKKDIKKDNRSHQLEWNTLSENRKNAYKTGANKGSNNMLGKFGALHHNSKYLNQYDLDGIFINQYAGTREAAKLTGLCQTSISLAARDKSKLRTFADYQWRFINDDRVVTKVEPYYCGAGKNHPQSRKVNKIGVCGNILKSYDNAGIAEEETGVNRMTIGSCCRKERNLAGGYKWEYV